MANFAADGDAEARDVTARVDDHNEMGCVDMLAFPPETLVVCGSPDAARPGEGLVIHTRCCDYLTGMLTARRLRPRARRRLITFAPAFERMRLRNP